MKRFLKDSQALAAAEYAAAGSDEDAGREVFLGLGDHALQLTADWDTNRVQVNLWPVVDGDLDDEPLGSFSIPLPPGKTPSQLLGNAVLSKSGDAILIPVHNVEKGSTSLRLGGLGNVTGSLELAAEHYTIATCANYVGEAALALTDLHALDQGAAEISDLVDFGGLSFTYDGIDDHNTATATIYDDSGDEVDVDHPDRDDIVDALGDIDWSYEGIVESSIQVDRRSDSYLRVEVDGERVEVTFVERGIDANRLLAPLRAPTTKVTVKPRAPRP